MPTEADICSAALVKLGASPITNFEDGTAEALIAGRLYPITRDALLSCHPWDFSLAEVALAKDTSVATGDDYAFFLPSDLLRTISAGAGTDSRGLAYRIQGNRLRSGSDTVTLAYQRRPELADYPAHFIAALVARLAAELALPITENSTRADLLQRLATAELRLARLVDSQQSTPQSIDDFILINVRQ